MRSVDAQRSLMPALTFLPLPVYPDGSFRRPLGICGISVSVSVRLIAVIDDCRR